MIPSDRWGEKVFTSPSFNSWSFLTTTALTTSPELMCRGGQQITRRTGLADRKDPSAVVASWRGRHRPLNLPTPYRARFVNTSMPVESDLSLLEMLGTTPLNELRRTGQPLRLVVPDSYLTDSRLGDPASEALAIQRLLALVHSESTFEVTWEPAAARRILASPALHPLAGITFCLNNAEHRFPVDQSRQPRLTASAARQSLLKHRLQLDIFSDCQMLLCVDHVRPSLPPDLYDPETAALLFSLSTCAQAPKRVHCSKSTVTNC